MMTTKGSTVGTTRTDVPFYSRQEAITVIDYTALKRIIERWADWCEAEMRPPTRNCLCKGCKRWFKKWG